MTLEEQKKFILEQRAKGTPDFQILAKIKGQEPVSKVERGFAGEIIPTLGAVAGGIGGGILGVGAGGIGAVPGAIAGATGGGALGELAQQGIERFAGQREKISPGQVIGSGAISGVVEAGTAGLGLVAKPFIKPALQSTKAALVNFLGKLSNYAPDVTEKALTRSPGVMETIGAGEAGLNKIIARSAKSVNNLAGKTLKEAKDTVNRLNSMSFGGKGDTIMRNNILQSSRNFIQNTASQLRKLDNIGVTKDGMLQFDRPTLKSRIVSGADQKTIQEGFNALKSIYKDTSIKNIDSVFEKLIVLSKKTPVGEPTGAETKAIINRMIDEVSSFTKSIPDVIGGTPGKEGAATILGQGTPGELSIAYKLYGDFIEDSLPKRIAIKEAQSIFGGKSVLSPIETSKVAKRLLSIYNTGNLAVREGVEKVSGQIGEDVTGGVAGTLIKTGKEPTIKATIPSAKGIAEKVVEFLPRKGIQNYIRTGAISGDLEPFINVIANVTGKSKKAILQEIVNLSTEKTVN